ncbi:ROK family protein [Paenibacillus macerans]|uniref:ROK family protein n=1 Tax=Paenibacillus macerans TaxID=44252 RepID=UPI003D319BEB
MKTNRANSIEVKKINRKVIYNFLYRHDPISIQDIAHSLQLSLPTVTQNLKDLQERDLVIETGLFESTGGRKAKAISYNPVAKYALGLDITRNHVGIVIIDLGGNVINHVRHTYPFVNKREYFEGIGRYVERFLDASGADRRKLLGVGIALPAILSHGDQTVQYAAVIDFQGGSIRSFEEFIPYPCVLINDANAAGMAEFWNEDGFENVVYLSLNNSVGGSVIIGKSIYAGQNQRSSEFGHMTVVPDGRTCYCGQRGCVDAYCSAKILSDSTNGSMAEFFRLLREKAPAQQALWDEYLSYLVIAINNLRMLYDCNVIVGGYVGAYMDEHLAHLQNLLAQKNTFEPDGSYLQVCKYKLEATAVGAALQQIKKFIDEI